MWRPSLLLSLLLACESGDATQLGASSLGTPGAAPEPGATSAAAAASSTPSGVAALPPGSNEGAATGAVALGSPVTAPAASLGPTTDAGGTEAPDAGLSSDAGAATEGDAGALPAPANDCCSVSASGGCADPRVAACVCEGDPVCCESSYDELCVDQAASRCGLDCDDRAPVSDCCSASDVPGCTVPEVAACICAIDPFCCAFRFDQNCVNLGLSQCTAVCAEGTQP
jgi:hypothetical protein